MPSFATLATIALVATASFVNAAPVAAVRRDDTPTSYAEGYLEDYDVYHARYLALDCKTQHNSTFFDECCHPMLANETLADSRASYCSPNATVSASVASTIAEYTSTATASATASADVDAESEYSSAVSSVDDSTYTWTPSVTASVTASETASASSTSTSADATATSTVAAVAEWANAKDSSSSSSSEHKDHSHSTESASETQAASETASTTSTSAASSTTTSSSSSTVQTGGYATFFYQDGVAGECGTVHSDSDYIIAIDAAGWWSDYETNDDSPYCGKYITITNTNNQKTVTAMVADVCPTCDTNNSLDLSYGAFTAIASESDGEVPITWVWA